MLQHCILPRFIHDRIVTFVIQRIGFVLTMEWIADPSIWAGLITLIVIELVLGIDNWSLLPSSPKTTAEAAWPRTCYRAAAGNVNAPVTAGVNLWLVTLTQPLFSFRSFTFSARDLIMLFGGFFLLFKATMELNERLEGKTAIIPHNAKVRSSGAWWRKLWYWTPFSHSTQWLPPSGWSTIYWSWWPPWLSLSAWCWWPASR